MNPVLTNLLEQRSTQEAFIENLLGRVAEENRDLVDAEVANLNAARERIGQIDAQIKPIEEFEAVRAAHRSTVDKVTSTADRRNEDQRAYERSGRLTVQPREVKYDTPGHYLADMSRALGYTTGSQYRAQPDHAAMERVTTVLGRSLDGVVMERAAGDVATGDHLTTGDVPSLLPRSIIGPILNDLDAMRPFVTSIGVRELTSISGSTFERPYISEHVTIGEQTDQDETTPVAAEKAELVSGELKTSSATFTKKTFGGWVNVSRQVLDWTDPNAWNILVNDLADMYGIVTEDTAAAAFAAAVTQEVEAGGAAAAVTTGDVLTVQDYIDALYTAAIKAATASGTKRASAKRMPNRIWTSVDMWGSLNSLLAIHRAENSNAVGSGSLTGFGGDILDVPRTMVPGLPSGTLIIGNTNLFEYYEQRIGVLQAIEPKVLGMQVAYGGYAAYGALDATGFVKVVNKLGDPA